YLASFFHLKCIIFGGVYSFHRLNNHLHKIEFFLCEYFGIWQERRHLCFASENVLNKRIRLGHFEFFETIQIDLCLRYISVKIYAREYCIKIARKMTNYRTDSLSRRTVSKLTPRSLLIDRSVDSMLDLSMINKSRTLKWLVEVLVNKA